MITDVRGSGKTVLLTELAAHFRERKDCTETIIVILRNLLKELLEKKRPVSE